MSQHKPNSKNTIETDTMTDEEYLYAWAAERKISAAAMDKLIADGFTSVEAMKLVETSDLSRNKITRGQQKLIMASVQAMNKISSQIPSHTQQSDMTTASLSDEQSGRIPSEGSAQQDNIQQCRTNDDVHLLMHELQSGQFQAQRHLGSAPVLNQTFSGGVTLPTQDSAVNCVQSDISYSWNNPQVYLAAAASGKSAIPYYDITDFVADNTEGETLIAGNSSQEVIFRSGPQKVKLENVTLAQWSVANLAILYKLAGEGKLHAGNILDYLSYTTKICQLAQKYSLISLWLYDREYRKLQASHDFRWGTEVPHLHSVHLQTRVPSRGPVKPKASRHNPIPRKTMLKATPMTLDRKVICKLYNTKSGCHFKDSCRYAHQCSQPGCYQWHSAVTHTQPKNY